MKKENMNQLKDFVKKVGSYQPTSAPKKPERQPSKKELEQAYIYKNGKIEDV